MRNTEPVTSEEPTGEEPDATKSASDSPASVGENDLAFPIPEWTMVPLAALFVGALVWGFGADRLLISLVPFAVLLAAITVIDLRELRVPNKLVGPGAAIAVPLLFIASTSDWASYLSFWRALLCGLAMFIGYFVVAVIYPPGMGLGDVKLSPIIGAQLGLFGWIPMVRGVILAFLIVGPVAILLIFLSKAGAKTGLPFAPFMAVGAIAALVLETL